MAGDDRIVRPMALFDRDGVLNRDLGYAYRPDQIEWTPGVFAALRLLKQRGYRVVVVTNQSGVARGFYSEADVVALHDWMAERIRAEGGDIDAFYYCPYHPQGSVPGYAIDHEDRKPRPGMINKALARFATDRAKSFLIGDQPRDIAAAEAAGVTGHLFQGKNLNKFMNKFITN